MFPIPIGIGERLTTTGSGKFQCPNCGGNREYRRERRAQYFYLCFVPLVPLNEWPERVVCTNCYSEFDKSVFFFNPDIEREERERRPDRIKLVMILAVLCEESVSAAAMARIQAAFQAEGGEAMTREGLAREIEDTRQLELDPLIELIQISQQLKPKGPSTVLKYAWLAATSDGAVSERQEELLGQLREALGISEVAYQRLVTRLQQSSMASQDSDHKSPEN